MELKQQAKRWIDANVWDGQDRSGTKDRAYFDPDDLQNLINDLLDDICPRNQWIPVSERLPETHDVDNGYWQESDELAVKVKGFNGWTTGVFIESEKAGFSTWRLNGMSGEFTVEYWYEVPSPPESES